MSPVVRCAAVAAKSSKIRKPCAAEPKASSRQSLRLRFAAFTATAPPGARTGLFVVLAEYPIVVGTSIRREIAPCAA